jgi:hypothetical protein
MVAAMENKNITELTHREIAAMGGRKVFEKRGSAHMAEIARRGRANLLKNDPGYFKRMADARTYNQEVKKQAAIAEEIGDTSVVNKLVRLLIHG